MRVFGDRELARKQGRVNFYDLNDNIGPSWVESKVLEFLYAVYSDIYGTKLIVVLP